MARLVPINCHDSGREIGAGEPCQATNMAEREVLTSRVLGGNLKLMGSEGNDSSFEYLLGQFGTGTPDSPLQLVVASPATACFPLENAEDAAGKAVLVIRGGGCDFARKAKQAQAAGAAAIIVYSKESDGDAPVVMGALPAWTVADVHLAVVSVGQAAGHALQHATEKSDSAQVAFTLDSAVTATAWLEVSMYKNPGAWPGNHKDRVARLGELKQRHQGRPERIAALEAAFALLSTASA
eukprot:TRINITY_DN1253_c0_g1_i2.p1 TRINITY_DN1253_c0_g1~~TRINITY_DN1253_c0_g1_i2.p1  ORF type:complete len:239 (+),score=56.38 TRINITY_DN1253_c0_g1_i2:147-863(+)